jgi:hypothetical protein
MDEEDVACIAEFGLGHARHMIAINEASPLEALRAGSLLRAWRLADLADPARRALWLLLLMGELKDADQIHELQATGQRLLARGSLHLEGDLGVCAAILLSQVGGDDGIPWDRAAGFLGDDPSRQTLARLLIAENELGQAAAFASQVASDVARTETLAAAWPTREPEIPSAPVT